MAQVLQHAWQHQQAGQIQEAEDLYRAILDIAPGHADANHHLGLLRLQTEGAAASLPHFEAALEAQPEQAHHWLNYIDALIRADRIETAHQVLDLGRQHGLQGEALENLAAQLHAAPEPTRAPAAANMIETAQQSAPMAGKKWASKAPPAKVMTRLRALHDQGKNGELERQALLLIKHYPDCGTIRVLLAQALQQQGKAALPAWQKAAQLLPGDAEVHHSLGAALRKLGRHHEAVASYRQTMLLRPADPATHSNLGNVLQEIGQLQEAMASYRRGLALKPDDATAHSNLGAALHHLGQHDAAIASYQTALSLKPDHATTLSNLGMAFKEKGQLEEAVASCRKAVAIKPDYAGAHNNLGIALKECGQFDAAVASFQAALAIKPDYAEAYSNLLFCLGHSDAVGPEALFAACCRFGEQFEAPLRANWLPHSNSRVPDRCLQVGFVSGDLRDHAVASFIEPVLRHLANWPQLSLHAYYNHALEDEVSVRLRSHLAHWHPIAGLSDLALADNIRADGIDILIDLSNHTAKNRLLTLARKPAPIQISWIGYPGTTGLTAVDYFLSDRFFLPHAQFDGQFTEKLVHLPAWAPFQPHAGAPPVNCLPAMTNGHLTFGSFNRPNKLNQSTIALWSQLLHALPNARMVLGAMRASGENDTVKGWFVEQGIALERLSFHPRSSMQDYLAMHHNIDICLDSVPFNGNTITHHALWMGVPTLTLAGPTPAARAGLALQSQIGLTGFIAHDNSQFVAQGLHWASHLDDLAAIRSELRTRFSLSPAGQPDVVPAAMARALRIMWQRWCADLAPASFEVQQQQV